MPDRETWKQRVAEWRASGLSSPVFCKGRGFSASGLRYWASRLEVEGEGPSAPRSTVALVRVLRHRGPRPRGRPLQEPDSERATSASAGAVVIRWGRWRVAVRPGCDRATLAAVLDEVAARGAAR